MTADNHTSDDASWEERLRIIVEMMRDMSCHTDPQEMVRSYAEKIRQLMVIEQRVSISRRGLSYPYYRITRSTTWPDDINPWTEKDRLPIFAGGVFADLIYRNETTIIDDLTLPADEPAHEYLVGHCSLLAIPMFDQGEALNMVVLLQKQPQAFDKTRVPELVWQSNLFGRATNNLVLKEELRRAYQALDEEMRIVGDIQRALLPTALPKIPTLDLAAHYQPAQRAGGDYYDFFPLPDGKWGVFIADVSGHGTPAAVVMAVTHCIAHTNPGSAAPPGEVLSYLNHHLTTRYAALSSTFVTAFYGIYDPAKRTLNYASAGHNPPQLKRCLDGSLLSLDQAVGLPLGILSEGAYPEAVQQLQPGDQIVFYTDGITEAMNPAGEQFGLQRLDQELQQCSLQATALLRSVLQAVGEFAAGRPADDDRTIVVARVVGE